MKHIYLIIVLIILLLLVAIFSPKVVTESYENTEELVLKSLQRFGRNLIFPYYGQLQLLASQRAETDIILQSNPQGKCNLINNENNYNPSYGILHEDGIFYKLKKSCIMLDFDNINATMSSYKYTELGGMVNEITFYLELKNETIIENIARFLLSNSLYVEFNINSYLTIAYKLIEVTLPSDSQQITNMFSNNIRAKKNKIIALKFVPVSSIQTTCDLAFKYIGTSYSILSKDFITTALSKKQLNMNVYYLDTLPCSFQFIGHTFEVSPTSNNRTSIFDPTILNSLASNADKIKIYEFMKNFVIMYNNQLFPVLTYNFKININATIFELLKARGGSDYTKVIFKCSMTNGYGADNGTSLLSLDNCNNNFVQVSMSAIDNENKKQIEITSSIGKNNMCGSTRTRLLLPYFIQNTIMSVWLTVGLSESIMYIEWINSGKKFSYSRSIKTFDLNSPCDLLSRNKAAQENNLATMFLTKEKSDEYKLAPIVIVWDKDIVTNVSEISFGYKTFVKEYLR